MQVEHPMVIRNALDVRVGVNEPWKNSLAVKLDDVSIWID